jgi:hypothetical protein
MPNSAGPTSCSRRSACRHKRAPLIAYIFSILKGNSLSSAGNLGLVTMERPAPDSQRRRLRFEFGTETVAQSYMRKEPFDEEYPMRWSGCPWGNDCDRSGGVRPRWRGEVFGDDPEPRGVDSQVMTGRIVHLFSIVLLADDAGVR